ncbi:MAG: hypothetical protein R3D66_06685 [Alphaproteobacteria bacterium]
MFNDFKGCDANGQPVKISAPPTLLVSSIGVIPHVEQSISLAPKAVGDLHLPPRRETKDECGGSEYYDMYGALGRNALSCGRRPHQSAPLHALQPGGKTKFIASGLAIGFGGLGVALAKKAIAGQMGLDTDLSALDLLRDNAPLFAAGCSLKTVTTQNKEALRKTRLETSLPDLASMRISNKLKGS